MFSRYVPNTLRYGLEKWVTIVRFCEGSKFPVLSHLLRRHCPGSIDALFEKSPQNWNKCPLKMFPQHSKNYQNRHISGKVSVTS